MYFCDLNSSCKSFELSYRKDCQSLISRSGEYKFGIFFTFYNRNQQMTLEDLPFFVQAMSSTISTGLQSYIILAVPQPFHEIYDLEHDNTSVLD